MTIPECRENEGDDYRRHRRGDSRWEGYIGSNEIRFLGSVDYQGLTMREGSAKKNSYGKSRNGRNNINMEGQRSNAGDEGETNESFGVPDCSIRSGDLDNEKTREKENRCFRVVVLEKSTESIMDGEKDKHMDHREHQTGMDTGVKGAKGCIKLLWARGERRRDGIWRDARENEWSEKERKTKTKMAGHTQGYSSGATVSNMIRDARDRAGWRGSDATRRHKVR